MKIRIAGISDLPIIKQCVNEAYEKYISIIGRKPASMETDFIPLIQRNQVYVGEYNESIIGLAVLIEEKDFVEIRSLAIFPIHQRQEFGSLFLDWAERKAKNKGCRTLRLYTNAALPALIKYYEQHGFEKVERKLNQGFDRVFMSRAVGKDS